MNENIDIVNQDPEMREALKKFAEDLMVSGIYNLYFSEEDLRIIKEYLSSKYSDFDSEKFAKDTKKYEIDVDTDPRVMLGDVWIIGTSETTLAVVAKVGSSLETVMECDIPEDISKIPIIIRFLYFFYN